MAINIKESRDKLLPPIALATLKGRYMLPEETSPQQAFARAALAYADDEAHAQRIYDYVSQGWFMFATPILSNGGTNKGLPISCFGGYVPDSRQGLLDHYTENAWLSSMGGGIGGYWGSIRANGTKIKNGGTSTGVIPFIKIVDSEMLAFSQGSCYAPGTEILTGNGWVKFEDLTYDDVVAQVDDSLSITYVSPTDIVKEEYEGKMIHVTGPNVDLLVTPNHSMVISRLTKKLGKKVPVGSLTKVRADKVKYHRDVIHHTSAYNNVWGYQGHTDADAHLGVALLDAWDMLIIAYQADGTLVHHAKTKGTINVAFHFSKERKILRLINILEALQESGEVISYTVKKELDDITRISVFLREKCGLTKNLQDYYYVQDLSDIRASLLLDEIAEWDGSHRGGGSTSFSWVTTNKSNADFVQWLAAICGRTTRYREVQKEDNRQLQYVLYVQNKNSVGGEAINKEVTEQYKGLVYCCVVPEGKIIVRYNNCVSVCGNTRRGSYAAYLDISHPEIVEFLNMRKPTGGDMNRKSLNLHHAVVIPDEFMDKVKSGDSWDLLDPHSGEIVDTLDARQLWSSILTMRVETGEPYIMWGDTCNAALPEALRNQGLKIHQSNLCCVQEDTLITVLKEGGEHPSTTDISIKDMVDTPCEAWNGYEWSIVAPYYAGMTDMWVTVTTQQGTLKVTMNHRFIKSNGSEVTAEHLNIGDILMGEYGHEVNNNTVLGVLYTKLDTPEPAYCYTDLIRGYGVFNGVLTGNSEIVLPTNEERTFVCCLSSVNLEKFDEWVGTPMVADLVRFLDNVLTFFIDNAPDSLSKAKFSAMRSRDIGLGAMGFHSFLQKRGIPFESVMAKVWNKKIFKYIKGEATQESTRLGLQRGFAPDLQEKISKSSRSKLHPQRNSHLLAIAPNASSSIIIGTSPSIEPLLANCFTQKTLSGSFEIRNPYLVAKLKELGKNIPTVWKSILANKGSVQHLDFLSDEDKAVFKTAEEIDQLWIIEHACDRQPFICQAQSVNLFFSPRNGTIDAEYLHKVHMKAWEGKLKTLYYLRSQASKRVENISGEVERMTNLPTEGEASCLSCEG